MEATHSGGAVWVGVESPQPRAPEILDSTERESSEQTQREQIWGGAKGGFSVYCCIDLDPDINLIFLNTFPCTS